MKIELCIQYLNLRNGNVDFCFKVDNSQLSGYVAVYPYANKDCVINLLTFGNISECINDNFSEFREMFIEAAKEILKKEKEKQRVLRTS